MRYSKPNSYSDNSKSNVGNTEIVKYLIEQGADVHHKNENNKDALYYAKYFGNLI